MGQLSACIICMRPVRGARAFNQPNHGDGYCIAASPPFRNRACWSALVINKKWEVNNGQAW